MKNYKFSVIFVTIYLIVFTIVGRAGAEPEVLFLMFSISPFLIVWMVYSVLKYGKYTGKDLSDKEEWGYEDV